MPRLFLAVAFAFVAFPAFAAEGNAELRAALESYLDKRFLPEKEAAAETDKLVKMIEAAKLTPEDVEKLLRSGRTRYEKPKEVGKLVIRETMECDHVDYTTGYFLFVPKSYDPAKAAPLLIIGHGGNNAMTRAYAQQASQGGVQPWLATCEREGMILAAPFSERGWVTIGDSIVLTLLSKMRREFHIDPDRVYISGHSMGGHLSWRSALFMPDRWGAVSPMSGGYDYVENKLIGNLFNVPGFATYGGVREPYDINKYNVKMKAWMEEHNFDWVNSEHKDRGHEIFNDEIPKIGKFFAEHPRDLYRAQVYTRGGGGVHNTAEKTPLGPNNVPRWNKDHTWKENHPIDRTTVHWLRVIALPKDTPTEKATQTIAAENAGNNKFVVTSENARKIRIYLHPKMVDFSKPVVVEVNGKDAFKGEAKPSLKTMLELVREFDDPGRIFSAAIDVDIATDREVPEPKRKK